MSSLIQIRNVPEDVHRRVKSRAAMAGMSISDYLLREIEQWVHYPSPEEVLAKIAAQPELNLSEEPTAALRAERDAR